MTRLELVTGIIAFAILAGIGVWVLIVRQFRKQELTQQQRMLAGIGLSVALGLFFFAMPVAPWVRVLGLVFAVVMCVSAIYQSNPKVQERMRARGREKEKEKGNSKARRTAAQDYMPYYKQRQQKHKRSK